MTPAGRGATARQLLRVHEWPKNLFIAAPLIFSGQLADPGSFGVIARLIGAFCAFSSSVYVVNDALDAPRDRQHPTKRFRPIASGRVPVRLAGAVALGLLGTGFALIVTGGMPPSVAVLSAGFLALNAVYSLYLKRKVIADVLAIAIGYVLRVLAGGAAIGVEVTHWLVLCTFLLATFLGFSKRRHELVSLGADSLRTRPVLSLYSAEFLDHASVLTLGMTLTCYVLYTIAPETVARYGTTALVYSSVIVMFALFRYLFLIHVKKLGSPVEALFKDRQIVLAIVCWLLYVIAVIYTWPALTRS